MNPEFQRHVDACNNARLPGDRVSFRIGTTQVGWVKPEIATALAEYDAVSAAPGVVRLNQDMANDLPAIAEALAARGLCRFRREEFDVRETPEGPVLARVDRGALPILGIAALGVHVNGLVRRHDGVHVWVAVRSRTKLLDPGKLDHLVAGGVASGMSVEETVVKEAAEEAALPGKLARRAVCVGRIDYAMERNEGLRRDTLYCYDLELPESFVPQGADGEVERFELWPVARVFETVRTTDNFKFNVNLVLIDLFQRLGLLPR